MVEASQTMGREDAQRLIDGIPFWYHTMEVAPGVTTPGYFDLRPVVDRLPWPDLRGKRCLDVATYDGFFAFEMERRGAAEVVAIDIADPMDHDWPLDFRATAPREIEKFGILPSGSGFRAAAAINGSKVEWRALSVYDLSPAAVGRFDFVLCGSLLIHLRDPLRALAGIRSVTTGNFMSSDQIAVALSLLAPRRPMFTLNGSGSLCQWFNFNAAGHEKLLSAAGFEIIARGRPYTDRLNRHPRPAPSLRQLARRGALFALTGELAEGVLHRALLTRPRPEPTVAS
jgi:tRNA (mo5U34)-methyltransferase